MTDGMGSGMTGGDTGSGEMSACPQVTAEQCSQFFMGDMVGCQLEACNFLEDKQQAADCFVCVSDEMPLAAEVRQSVADLRAANDEMCAQVSEVFAAPVASCEASSEAVIGSALRVYADASAEMAREPIFLGETCSTEYQALLAADNTTNREVLVECANTFLTQFTGDLSDATKTVVEGPAASELDFCVKMLEGDASRIATCQADVIIGRAQILFEVQTANG